MNGLRKEYDRYKTVTFLKNFKLFLVHIFLVHSNHFCAILGGLYIFSCKDDKITDTDDMAMAAPATLGGIPTFKKG